MKKYKMAITISRYWNNPKIMTVLWADGISLTCELEDFLLALQKELGSVRWIFRDKTFRAKFEDAVKVVIQRLKQESAKVV
jgi:hypothetical protein